MTTKRKPSSRYFKLKGLSNEVERAITFEEWCELPEANPPVRSHHPDSWCAPSVHYGRVPPKDVYL